VNRDHGGIDDLDPFDVIEEAVADELYGFTIISPLDSNAETWESDGNDPFCTNGLGDDNGLCIKEQYGCSYIGCPHSDSN